MIVNMNVNVVRKSRDMWGLGQNITVIILLAQNIQDHVWKLYIYIYGLMLSTLHTALVFSLHHQHSRCQFYECRHKRQEKLCFLPRTQTKQAHATCRFIILIKTIHSTPRLYNTHRQTHNSHISQLGSMLVLYWLGTVNLNLNGKAPSFIDYHLSKSILNSA